MATTNERTHISVHNIPNGYSLTVDKNSYIAFNERELLEEIFVHVGLEKNDYMNQQTIHDLMVACATYPNEGDAIRRVAELESQIEAMELSHQRDLDNIRDLKERLADTASQLSDLRAEYIPHIPRKIRKRDIAIADIKTTKKKPVKVSSEKQKELEHKLRDKGILK